MMTPQAATRGQGPSSALSPDPPVVTRFAPSPTGRLHLGHAYSAILAHDFARARGGRFLLRIENIDPGRSRPEYVDGIFEDLAWLGLTWDGEILFQSQRLPVYQAALDRLRTQDLLYPCFCSRKDIEVEIAASASAPHGPDGPVYPGTCRALHPSNRERLSSDRPHAWRLDMGKALATLSFPPALAGRAGGGASEASSSSAAEKEKGHPQLLQQVLEGSLMWFNNGRLVPANPARFGDIVLARKDAPASYHLAVTIDDAAQHVTDIVRGADLFDATHVHRLLQALLGLPTPRYHHHPLLLGPDGTRLAKRHGAPALADLRAGGADPREVAQNLRTGRLPAGYSATRT